MSWNGWKTHPNGDVAVSPLVGYSSATFMNGMAAGVRLEYAIDQSLQRTDAVQLILTPAQARELGEKFIELANRMEVRLAADKPVGPAN